MLTKIKKLENSLALYKARRRSWITTSKCVDLKSVRWFNEEIRVKELLIKALKGG